jgi:hypothetical protein
VRFCFGQKRVQYSASLGPRQRGLKPRKTPPRENPDGVLGSRLCCSATGVCVACRTGQDR